MSISTKIKDFFTEGGHDFVENDRSIITTCPQCGKEKHLYLFKENGSGKCMKCGTSFSAAAVVVALTGCTYFDAFKILDAKTAVKANQRLSFSLESEQTKKQKEGSVKHIPLPSNFYSSSSKLSGPGIEYLLKRGCWDFSIDYYNVHYCPSMKRVIFPFMHSGGYVGWQGRDITGQADLRYLTSRGFSKGAHLMGLERVSSAYNHVILTEGPVDCMRVAIMRNAVCSLGKLVSKAQLGLLKGLDAENVYLALDPDAFEVFDEIAASLRPEKKIFLMMPPEGRKDFGECTDKEIMKAFKEAKPYSKGSMLSGAILR